MQEIIAIAVPLEQASFRSPSEAIEDAKLNDANQRTSLASVCQERTIDRVLWNDGAVRIFLEGGYVVEIACNGNVGYKIYDAPPDEFYGSQYIENVVAVKFPDGRYEWNRGELIAQMVHRKLKRILLRQDHLLLYVADNDIILFNGMLDTATMSYFLFWSPAE